MMNNTNQKVKTVTRIPDFLLRLKGKIDAFCGETVVDANVARYYDRLYAIEHEEAAYTEFKLRKVRMKAANCISAINAGKADIASLPSAVEEKHDSDVRANLRNRNAASRIASSISVSRNEIIEAQELIISGKVILEQRIGTIRDLAEAKIRAYVTGVRSNKKLRGYEIKGGSVNNHAMEAYEQGHCELDEAIQCAAYEIIKEGN